MKLKMTTKLAYFLLVVSIFFEQVGTGLLGATDAFKNLVPTLCMIGAYIISYWFFAQVLKYINLSICYATWTALGTVSAALIGFFAFDQVISVTGWIAIIIMGIGIFILNLFGDVKENAESEGEQK